VEVRSLPLQQLLMEAETLAVSVPTEASAFDPSLYSFLSSFNFVG
jgi:hypothetical protein